MLLYLKISKSYMGIGYPLDYIDAPKIVEYHQAKGEKVVLARGTFDILHPGHLEFLERAKDLGKISE